MEVAVSVFACGEMIGGDDDCGVVEGVPGAGVRLDSGCAELVFRPSAATQVSLTSSPTLHLKSRILIYM